MPRGILYRRRRPIKRREERNNPGSLAPSRFVREAQRRRREQKEREEQGGN